jgi:hypothetical protein
MAHPGFGHLWQQDEMPDIDIVVSVVNDNAPTGDEAHKAQDSTRNVLQQFPGHRMILPQPLLCGIGKTHMLRWPFFTFQGAVTS